MATVEVVGVYPVGAPEPCHLVEVIVRRSERSFDIGAFTQPAPGQPPSGWQVGYAEKLLDGAGETVLGDPWVGEVEDDAWTGDVRLAFFFHYLDPSAPLRTPFGDVALPAPTERPDRLNALHYEEPC